MRRIRGALVALALVAAGPAGMAERVAAKLRKAVPGATITVVDAATLKFKRGSGSEMTISLDRLRDFCSVNAAEDCRAEEERFVNGTVEMATIDYTVTRERLRVIVRSRDYVEGMAPMFAGKPDKLPVSAPFAPGVSLILAADFPNTTRMVGSGDLKTLGIERDAAMAQAIDNTLKDLPPVPKADEVKGKLVALAGYDYGASVLLRPERWRPLAEATGGTLFVAIPSDDNVLIGTAAPGDQLAKIRELVSEDYATAARGISPLVYRWSPAGWVPAK